VKRGIQIVVAGGLLLAVFAIAGVALLLWITRPPEPDAFADPPSALPQTPGSLIRTEPFTRGVPAGARGWRLLYSSTGLDGAPVAVTATVVVPAEPREEPLPVIAYAHGTYGVATGCAPSLAERPFAEITNLDDVVRRGWALVATDYPGLGTPGQHPYLVGDSAARAVVDSVRAARAAELGVELQPRMVVWGISQGGHAALFTGRLAPELAPELELVGVAALEPPTAMAELLQAGQSRLAGTVLTAEAVYAWSRIYPELSFEEAIRDRSEAAARALARRCLPGPSAYVALTQAAALRGRLLAIDLARDSRWRRRLDENTPAGGIAAPLLIAQGGKDTIVLPAITRAFVAARCADGDPVTYREYGEATHLNLMAFADDDVASWTADRFAGTPATSNCPSSSP